MKKKKEQDIGSIKLFVRGDLTGKKLAAFKKCLESDDKLRKQVDSYQLLMEVANLYSQDMDFRAMVAEVHQEYIENINYSYEELKQYFNPNNKFIENPSISKVYRKGKRSLPAKEIKLKKPKEGFDVTHELKFQLEKKYNFKLMITIFDNEENRISIGEKNIDKKVTLEDKGRDIIIAQNTKKFSLLFNNLKPGIYYWRLKPKSIKKEDKYKFVTRSFYIRKDLMPKELQDENNKI